MFNIQFPGFGLEFKLSPVAFTLGNLEVRWYGILIALGFLTAFFYATHECKHFNLSSEKITDCSLIGLVTGIIGARIYYVVFYPDSTYIENPISVLNIHEGGIAIYGGIIGGLLGGLLFAKIKGLPLLKSLDIVSVSFLIGQSIGRWGNFTNQEAFGVQTDNIFRMISENTNGVGVHPCFLYESVWCFIGIFVLHIFNRKLKKFNGQTFLLYLIWYGVERLFVEALRVDSLMVPTLNLRVSQLVAVFTVLCSLVTMIYLLHKKGGNKIANN